MEKFYYKVLVITVSIICTLNCLSQWLPAQRLSNTTGIHPVCTSDGANNLHVLWEHSGFCYIRSINGGFSWSSDVRGTFNSSESQEPNIASLGLGVHVVRQDLRDGNFEIYYRRSTDGGFMWDASGCSSGVYFYSMTAGNFSDTKKMVLIK